MKNSITLLFLICASSAFGQNFSLYAGINPLQTNDVADFGEATSFNYTEQQGIGYGLGLMYHVADELKAFVEVNQMARTIENGMSYKGFYPQEEYHTYRAEGASYSALAGLLFIRQVGDTRFYQGGSLAGGVRYYSKQLYSQEDGEGYLHFVNNQRSQVFIASLAYEVKVVVNKTFEVRANLGLSSTPMQAGLIYNINN